MFYAALDVSLRSVAVCIIDQGGKVRLEISVPSEVPDPVRCLQGFCEPIHQVGLEAGTLTQHLTYGLREAGFEVVCMEGLRHELTQQASTLDPGRIVPRGRRDG